MRNFFEQFCELIVEKRIKPPGKIEKNVGFADLMWHLSREDCQQIYKDPGIEITTDNHWIVFLRVKGEIRYYLERFESWEKRYEKSSSDIQETTQMGVVLSVEDAVLLAQEFLQNSSWENIDIECIPPPWERSG